VLSPPTLGDRDFVEKIHICPDCWRQIAAMLEMCPHKWSAASAWATDANGSYRARGRACPECGAFVATDGDYAADAPAVERPETRHKPECWDGAPRDMDDPDGPKWNGCCCKCVHQIRVMSHPWYDGMPISHQIGWACVLQKGEAMMLSCEHGMCECFERKRGKEK